MGRRGPKPISQKALYDRANELYWAFRQLGEGYFKNCFDRHRYKRTKRDLRAEYFLNVQDGTDFRRFEIAYEKAYGRIKVPGKPEALQALLTFGSAAEVRHICKGAFRVEMIDIYQPMSSVDGPRCVLAGQYRRKVLNWPIISGGTLPHFLSRHAERFVVAKTDARYPASTRRTSEFKRLWYLARALAGTSLGITTRSAINVLGSLKPKESFEQSECG
jgi:hypothetical protein